MTLLVTLHTLDYVILAILLAGVILGWMQGFVVQLATLVGAVVALIAARLGYRRVHQFLSLALPHGRWLTAISYLLIFGAVWIVIIALARRVRFLVRLLLLGAADRLGGALLGLLEATIVVQLLVYLGKRLEGPTLRPLFVHSALATPFLHVIPYIDQLFPHLPRA